MHKPGELNLKLVAVVTMLLLTAGAFALGVGSHSDGPVTNGTPTEAADLTNPAVQALVKNLDARIDTCTSLQENAPKLTGLIQQIDLLADDLSKKLTDPDLTTAKDKIAEIKTNIQKLLDLQSECNNAKTTVSATEIKEVWAKAQQAGRDLANIGSSKAFGSNGSASTTIDFAKLLIAYNHPAGGGTLIARQDYMSPVITRAQVASLAGGATTAQALFDKLKDGGKMLTSSDCSGFISYVLIATGAANSSYSTSAFILQSGFQKIREYTPDQPLIKASFEADLANGTIKPGDIIISNVSADGYQKIDDNSHATMILSTTFDDPHGIAQARSNGPEYQNLKDRVGIIRWGNERGMASVVLRPNYK
jgi:hypothetical protein